MIQTTLGIEGMMCGMCESHVNDAIRKAFNVQSAKSNRRKKQCVVVSEEELDPSKVSAAIEDIGYELTSISSESYRKRGIFGFGQRGK